MITLESINNRIINGFANDHTLMKMTMEGLAWNELLSGDAGRIRAALKVLNTESLRQLSSLHSWLSHLEFEEMGLEELLLKIYSTSHLCICAGELPEGLKYLECLQWLEITVESTTSLTESSVLPRSLTTLYLKAPQMTSLSLDREWLTKLAELEIVDTPLHEFELLGKGEMRSLSIKGTMLRTAPDVGESIENLLMPDNPMMVFQLGCQLMPHLRRLDLRGCLVVWKSHLGNPYPQLTYMDLSRTRITEIVPEIYGWGNGLVLDLSNTLVTELPASSTPAPNVSRIDLTNTPYSRFMRSPELTLLERKKRTLMVALQNELAQHIAIRH